ncbi:MAG: molecular chaperone [Bryobacteraceae bacterium]|nr:MAG: molecular chaperone [Bryobacteraceae bacterium]
MRLGIDFGTTRIVAAAADRGNFPVVSFECPDGAAREWAPPLIAVQEGRRLYGWDAWAAQGVDGVTVLRSIKRVLASSGPETLVELAGQSVRLATLLEELLVWLKNALLERSSLPRRGAATLEVLLGVPANANSNQRFLTAEAFRAAGFRVLGLLNEPSAASIEYTHRTSQEGLSAPQRILVYDLGGGTFDASLVYRDGNTHVVEATESIPTLGGDDFDDVLAALALEKAGLSAERPSLSQAEEFLLLEECREKKEALHPNTRRLMIDLDRVRPGWPLVSVPVAEYYEQLTPLVEETLHATEDLLERAPQTAPITLYVTGGASELPLVSRLLRERFGRRVKRSAYTRSATAIGLAIQASAHAPAVLRERFTRFFGVWREAEGGRAVVFDPLFEQGLELPAPGASPIKRTRRYSPVHNIGHFRYLECSHRTPSGEPAGDITAWDEIRFPFDPRLASVADLENIAVERSPEAARQWIEEAYMVDSGGSVTVVIFNLTAGYHREYRLGQWASAQKTIRRTQPAVRKRRRASRSGGEG